MTIEIELDAYVIPAGHTVWKSTAGKTHRFYRAVRDARTIFPDVRELGSLAGDPGDWSDQRMLRAIAEDRASRTPKANAQAGDDELEAVVSKQDRTVLTFLKRLWFEAKEGDLIMVPPDGWREPVLIGQIMSKPGDIRRVTAIDGNYTGDFFGRPVRWLTSVAKQDVTPELLKVIHTRTAVFPCPESVKEELYRYGFGNFVYRGRYVSEFQIAKERFTTDDSVAMSIWLNGFDVLRNSMERGDIRNGDSFAALGLDRLPAEEAAEIKINIQSPGEVFVRTTGPFALSLMALFALASCDAETVDKDQVTVKLKEVDGDPENVTQIVQDDVNAIKAALGENRFREQGTFGKRAREDAQMSTRAHLKITE